MPLLNSGRDFIASRIMGTAAVALSHLAVGDSTTVFSSAHTDLQAATNKLRKAFDGAADVTGAVITAVATFGGTDANFSWQEFGMANDVSAGTLFNRFLDDQGTKTAGQVWELTMTTTIVNADE